MFSGFNKDSIKFLQDMQKNNNKIWFENNRERYEKAILEPNKAYVEEMGEHLQVFVPSIKANPKVSGSLFKIYRDIRFSKDKTPMKSKIGILFWQGESHRMQSSCFYMHYDVNEVFYASGVRSFKTPLLKAYREYIKCERNRNSLHDIIQKLKKKGYSFPQAHYKRYPDGFDKDDENIYLCLFNSMYAYKIFSIDEVFFTEKVVDRAFNLYDDMFELQQWVYELTLTVKED